MKAIAFTLERKIVTKKYESLSISVEFTLEETDHVGTCMKSFDSELKAYLNTQR